METIEIDGNMGEGGGSILRLSAAFAVLFKKKLRIINIRANRTPPGLKAQHLLGLIAVRVLSGGTMSDIKIGSTELEFTPGNLFKTPIEIKIDTAGSIGLLSQILQIAAIGCPIEDKVIINMHGGGTFGTGAPDPYYINDITYQYFQKMGYQCEIRIMKDGFYPKGGADAQLIIQSLKNPENELKSVQLLHIGSPQKIGGTIVVSENLRNARVGERIQETIMSLMMKSALKIPKFQPNDVIFKDNFVSLNKSMFDLKVHYKNTLNPGVGLSIWMQFDSGAILGSGTILGEIRKSSEKVATEAVESLLASVTTGATVDEYMSDQIIPFLYLAKEPSTILVPTITSHMKTNIDLLNLFKKREYRINQFGKIWKFEYL
jgi:RNA 3'-phosphate cyclase